MGMANTLWRVGNDTDEYVETVPTWVGIQQAPALAAAQPTNKAKQHDCMQVRELVGTTLGSPSGLVHTHQVHRSVCRGQTHIQRHLEAISVHAG